MIKTLTSRFLEIALVLLIYFGAYLGNEYAQNILMPYVWITITLSVFVLISLSSEKAKADFMKERKPRSQIAKSYSLIYDCGIAFALCAFDYQFTGVVWFFVRWFVWCLISSEDKKLQEKAP